VSSVVPATQPPQKSHTNRGETGGRKIECMSALKVSEKERERKKKKTAERRTDSNKEKKKVIPPNGISRREKQDRIRYSRVGQEGKGENTADISILQS